MRSEIKTKWVEALRSGKYQQTSETLRTSTGNSDQNQYCCLGVLCDLAREEGIGYWDQHNYFVTEVGDGDAALPKAVSDWAGFPPVEENDESEYWDDWVSDPEVNAPTSVVGKDTVTLSYLNDTVRFDFKQIADVIEKEL